MAIGDRTFVTSVETVWIDPDPEWPAYWADVAREHGCDPAGEPSLEWYDKGPLRVFTMRGPVTQAAHAASL